MIGPVPKEGSLGKAECPHCRFPVARTNSFCCRGCEAAYSIISGAGLEDFYELRGTRTAGPPRTPTFERASEAMWLEETAGRFANAADYIEITVGVAGLYCAACVWLIERTAMRQDGVAGIVLNPARGVGTLTVSKSFDLHALAEKLAAIGYRLVPPTAGEGEASSGLLARTGIAFALALNSMMLAAAIYLGLDSGFLHTLFVVLSAVLAVGSLVVGGGYFGRRALTAIANRAISLDVPIALGIVAVFVSSLWAALTGRGGAVYFDSLSVFIALMLAGRLLQERILRANRDRIASSETLLELSARRVENGKPISVAADELVVGDLVLVPPGEVVPSEIRLTSARAGCRLDWITGESEPRLFRSGETICAGATNASKQAFQGIVVAELADTELPALLAAPTSAQPESATATSRKIASIYLAFVLLAATAGFVAWLFATGDVPRAFEVAAAILVVTCPCALGIGAPLAFELIAGRLARSGAYVRTGDAIAKMQSVTQIAFDKTGTVTEASLSLANPEAFESLSGRERHVLFNLAARSGHPRSEVIAQALDGELDDSIEAFEEIGLGVRGSAYGHNYRLGREDWAAALSAPSKSSEATVFSVDNRVLARPTLVETLRPDAKTELVLLADRGVSLALISGDRPGRVEEIARELDIPRSRVLGAADPTTKAGWVKDNDRSDLLFVGDGLNDAPALEAATVSATPSFESPLVASRVDMYFNGRGLRPIRLALEAAALLKRLHRGQLVFVVAYNLLVVSVALAGWMQPWLAAILMPASSLLVTTNTALAVRKGIDWQSSRS